MKWGAPGCHVPPLHVLHSVLLGSPRQSLSEAGEWAPAGSVKHPMRIPNPEHPVSPGHSALLLVDPCSLPEACTFSTGNA